MRAQTEVRGASRQDSSLTRRCYGRSALVCAVDDGTGDGIAEQIETQEGGSGVLGDVEALHTDGVHGHQVAVRPVSGRRGGTEESTQAGVVGQGERIARQRTAVTDTVGASGS